MIHSPVIIAEHITKEFVLHRDETLLQRIAALAHGKERPEKLCALNDVSLSVAEGEVLGIIGKNGSGKSTLLRILARIYEADKGSVKIRGRVVPLINLSVGLQQRLNMKDNIYLACSMFGLSRGATHRKFDSIVEFAELEDFVDMQLYQFSSGMMSRLAFSIAVHSDPEVLLLDEVFESGDVGFKQKSSEKMAELIRNTTVVMASHSEGIIQDFADRVMWLEKGRREMEGGSEDVIDAYLGKMNAQKGDEAEKENRDVPSPLHRQKEEQIVVS